MSALDCTVARQSHFVLECQRMGLLSLRRRFGLFGTGLLALLVVAPSSKVVAEACGTAEQPCLVEDGSYHVALPDLPEGAPLVLWLHGHASSGANAIRYKDLVDTVTGRGYALIAANGQPGWPGSDAQDWDVEDGIDFPRDDIAFIAAVLDDAVQRFGLDGNRVLAAGFSRGGSMIWDLACKAPETAKGYAAVAGAFWEPMAEDCLAPVHLQHSHGFQDRLVPFEGRAGVWQGYNFEQGNVMKGLDTWRRVNGCLGSAEIIETEASPWSKAWTTCEQGSLTLYLTEGGHGIPKGWTDRALDWFEALD